ncbi:MAG: DUF1018 domain-containing protein [Cardiobacteriaceae bacterium]|nr:DUF1018 domain-containing protein [Cardiobacteriaceae bacterium]
MKSRQNLRQTLIAKIHIGKKFLNLSEEAYRHLLISATGCPSCKDMGIAQLSLVLEALKAQGFEAYKAREPRPITTPKQLLNKRLLQIKALLKELGKTPSYLNAIAQRNYQCLFNDLDDVGVLQIFKILQKEKRHHHARSSTPAWEQ